MNAKITDFMDARNENDNGTPFPDYNITADDYLPIDVVVDRRITIYEAKPFENDKGPGVFVLFMTDAGQLKYIVTHSVGIVSILTEPKIQAHLAEDNKMIDCRVVKRQSKKTNRMFYTLDD